MRKVLFTSFVVFVFCFVLQLSAINFSQQGFPAAGPNNCDNPNRDVPHGPRIPPDPNAQQPLAGPPCPPTSNPVPPPAPQPPIGPEVCIDSNDPFGPGPHIAGQLPTGPTPPAGPPLPPCPPPPASVSGSVGVEMLLPPRYRVGSAPFLWLKTTSSAYVYIMDVDPERQVFLMSGVGVTTANSWHLFGEGTWLENPIGTDSVNAVVSSSPLPISLESALMNSQNYDWAGQYYVLNQAIQQQLASLGATYTHQSYEITN